MNRNWRRWWLSLLSTLILLFTFACLPQTSQRPIQAQPTASQSSPLPAPAPATDAWSLLQQNPIGYVVIMRHAIAPGTGDPGNFRLDDCRTQRNLSGAGRDQAKTIGQTFRDRKIPIHRVLSSEWCRCLETAKLLNLGKVEPFPALNSFFQDSRTEAAQTAELQRFIVENRNTKGVSILVTHQVNITALTDIFPDSGEAIALKADPKGQVQTVGRLGNP